MKVTFILQYSHLFLSRLSPLTLFKIYRLSKKEKKIEEVTNGFLLDFEIIVD